MSESNGEMEKRRYCFIDIARVIALAFIVYYHALRTLDSTGIRMLEQIQAFYKTKNLNIATLAVGLFFMISGAGLMSSYANKEAEISYLSFLKKRFIKLMIPFYISYVVALGVNLIKYHSFSIIFGEKWKPWRFVFPMFGIDGFLSSIGISASYIGVGEWFLGALLVSYLIFPFLFKGLSNKRLLTIVIMNVYFALLIVFYKRIPLFDRIPIYTNPFIKLYEFFIGMLLINLIDDIPIIVKRLLGIVSIIVLIFYLWYPTWLSEGMGGIRVSIQNIAFFLLFYSMEDVLAKIKTSWKMTRWLCSISYDVFLTHHVILNVVISGLIGILPYESNVGVLLAFVISFVMILICSLLLDYITKKVLEGIHSISCIYNRKKRII